MSDLRPDSAVQPYTMDDYIHAATRDNTRKTYRSAVEHFEVTFGGRLPTTPDVVCRYLTHFAATLAFNTLKTRLAALSQWHQSQGFVDPTKAPQVKKILKGVRALHPAPVKKARPLDMCVLHALDTHLLDTIKHDTPSNALRARRDRALIWVGFWRGFRSDELTRLRLENIHVRADNTLSLYLPQSKGDRQYHGKDYTLPRLIDFCPVDALTDWQQALNQTQGPVFRKIDRWGVVGQQPLNAGSVSTILQRRLVAAKIDNAMAFSSHSLRRGFAHWASDNQWDLNELMHYVGWQDPRTAMQYVSSHKRRSPSLRAD